MGDLESLLPTRLLPPTDIGVDGYGAERTRCHVLCVCNQTGRGGRRGTLPARPLTSRGEGRGRGMFRPVRGSRQSRLGLRELNR